MGIYSSFAKLVIGESANYKLGGSALTLGVNHFNYDANDLKRMFREVGVSPRQADRVTLNYRAKTSWLKSDALDARTLFHWLGFERVDEMDAYADEKPSLLHDLNHPVPKAWHGQYDLVLDAGTSEHVFDVRQTLFNIVDLLKSGGTAIHASPLSGWINHGFYQFCPSLLWSFYRASGFSHMKAFLLQVSRVQGVPSRVWEIADPPGEPFLFNDFHCKTLLVVFARKTEASRPTIPMQGNYATTTERQFSSTTSVKPLPFIARSEPKVVDLLRHQGWWLHWLWKILPPRWFDRIQAPLMARAFDLKRVRPRASFSDSI